MRKTYLSRLFLAFITLLLPINGLIAMQISSVTKAEPLQVLVTSMPESELSKSLAGLVEFFTDGFKHFFKPFFVMQDKEKKHLEAGENIQALHSAMFRGIIMAVPPLMGILIIGGSKIGLKILKQHLLASKPTILNKAQNPCYGRLDRLKQWWSPKHAQQMIFNNEIKNQLSDIVKKTVMLQKLIKSGKKRSYTNLLLYGYPGVGKTLFAQTLAHKTNMDFLPVTAASLLQKGIEGIKYFDELIEMANGSPYGTIIFIDEADGLFVDRNLLNPDSDHYKILEHILSVVDGRSNKYMIVAATNRSHILDHAMNRRFQDQIELPLPDAAARKKLLELYIDKVFLNEKEVSTSFIEAAHTLFTIEYIDTIVHMTAGLSHAEIADMIEAIRNKVELNKKIIETTDVENAVNHAIMKHKK